MKEAFQNTPPRPELAEEWEKADATERAAIMLRITKPEGGLPSGSEAAAVVPSNGDDPPRFSHPPPETLCQPERHSPGLTPETLGGRQWGSCAHAPHGRRLSQSRCWVGLAVGKVRALILGALAQPHVAQDLVIDMRRSSSRHVRILPEKGTSCLTNMCWRRF